MDGAYPPAQLAVLRVEQILVAKRITKAICWIRRDLRLSDHAPLASATRDAEAVAVVFVFDTVILQAIENRSDRRLEFIHRSLAELDRKLRAAGSRLIVLHGDPTEEIPRIAAELGVQEVYTAQDYEPYARSRDAKLDEKLREAGCELRLLKDTILFDPGQIATAEGNPFRVYTPFRRALEQVLAPARDLAEHLVDQDSFWPTSNLPQGHELPDLNQIGFTPTDLWLEAGEDAGIQRLHDFARRIDEYKDRRDFPAGDHTSGLSVHLRFGTISIRSAARLARSNGSPGAESWFNELIWREFYQHLLFHFPNVVQETFQPAYANLRYPGEESHWIAWCEGKTGYPIVDAAMRCFNATGWMHNRLRMIVASFLTKDLLHDYRRGETYFADGLLDFDLASNNGGWQWAASVGADAQPYFRIFNPVTQSLKFDPDGQFIRTWLPELAALPNPDIHWPSGLSEFDLLSHGVQLNVDYPSPIVDHAVQRELAIALLSSCRDKTAV
jgi:deoxyribodipyrimidine photo-lyase